VSEVKCVFLLLFSRLYYILYIITGKLLNFLTIMFSVNNKGMIFLSRVWHCGLSLEATVYITCEMLPQSIVTKVNDLMSILKSILIRPARIVQETQRITLFPLPEQFRATVTQIVQNENADRERNTVEQIRRFTTTTFSTFPGKASRSALHQHFHLLA